MCAILLRSLGYVGRLILHCSVSTTGSSAYWYVRLALRELIEELLSLLHCLGPVCSCQSFYSYIWDGTIDSLLISLYLGYGCRLLKSSFNFPEHVRLSDVSNVLLAERVAGFACCFRLGG
ncbi:hypothetical protein O9993_06705 [Vibrio lentus]|nr:hypothetical protein [Vibrio lentus]